jgi:hypothetical protein
MEDSVINNLARRGKFVTTAMIQTYVYSACF